MGCKHCTLTSADLAANSAEGIYSWTEAAVYKDERCLQAARAAYASFDKKHYQLTILLVTGWWRGWIESRSLISSSLQTWLIVGFTHSPDSPMKYPWSEL